MTALRMLDTGVQPARWNIAATAALAQLRSENIVGDTLRWHRYPRSVLLGRNQPAKDIDPDYCAANGVEIARRVTGGGAVYMNEQVLAFDLVLPRSRFAALEDVAAVAGRAIPEALRALGSDAAFTPPNAVTIGGRKVSGFSGTVEGRAVLVQGTIIIALDTAEMAASLRLPAHAVAGVSGVNVDMALLTEKLSACFARALGAQCFAATFAAAETARTQSLLDDEIGRDEFVFDLDPPLRRSA